MYHIKCPICASLMAKTVVWNYYLLKISPEMLNYTKQIVNTATAPD